MQTKSRSTPLAATKNCIESASLAQQTVRLACTHFITAASPLAIKCHHLSELTVYRGSSRIWEFTFKYSITMRKSTMRFHQRFHMIVYIHVHIHVYKKAKSVYKKALCNNYTQTMQLFSVMFNNHIAGRRLDVARISTAKFIFYIIIILTIFFFFFFY